MDVYVGRAGLGFSGYFGSPYRLHKDGDRKKIVGLYRKYFHNRLATDEEFRNRVNGLKGARLGCYCAPKPCHADIIAAYLNAQP